MAKSKLPTSLQAILRFFSPHCPICGKGKKDKRRSKSADETMDALRELTNCPLRIRRWTSRTITRECRDCGLRFSFTWAALYNALRNLANAEPTEKGKNFYFNAAMQMVESYPQKDDKNKNNFFKPTSH